MKDTLRAILRFARDAAVTERESEAGRINMVGMAMVFVVVNAASAAELLQAIVRIFRPSYVSKGTPVMALLFALILLTLACIVLVGLINPLGVHYLRGKRDTHNDK